jgi:hypothetical protein
MITSKVSEKCVLDFRYAGNFTRRLTTTAQPYSNRAVEIPGIGV